MRRLLRDHFHLYPDYAPTDSLGFEVSDVCFDVLIVGQWVSPNGFAGLTYTDLYICLGCRGRRQ
jgi:hypothetical protein